MPDFRIRLNGVHIPEIKVQRPSPDGEIQLAVRDEVLGWFVVDASFTLEFRDETSWALLPIPMRRDSRDKGWNRATPDELIGILWNVGVLK